MEMDSSPSVHQDHNHFEAPNPASLLPFATSAFTVDSPSSSSAEAGSASSPAATVRRYENRKRRDWNTFEQYLRNHMPPLSLSRCSGAHVLEFLRYLDQFGKTKVHTQLCPFFGHPNPPAPCACPLRQAWGSLDALIGRLSAAFEEHGGKPENNPFGAWAVRLYLREVRDSQSKARGISYEKKERKRPTTASVPQQQELELQQQHHQMARPSSPPRKHSTTASGSSSSSSSLTSGSHRLFGIPMVTGEYDAPSFLFKLYELVDDRDTDGLISWNDAGSGFIIRQPSLLEKELLPKNFFNCHTFSAFVRHLTTVLGFVEEGFVKSGGDQWEFSRNDFRRGRPLFDVHDLVTSRNSDPIVGAEKSSMMVEEVEKEHMFDKVLTPSDVGNLNRLVIPRHHAEKYFPLLDGPPKEKGLPLDFQDGNGKQWRWRYSYWNSCRCYVMTKGWRRFVEEKNLDVGDIISFQRGAEEDSRHRLFIDLKRRPTTGTHPYSPAALHLNLNTSLQPVSELSCVTTEADEIETTNEDDNLTFHDSEQELFTQRPRKASLARYLPNRADRLSSKKRSAVVYKYGDWFSAFSDCNSDRSGEFPTTSGAETRRLLPSCAAENSNDLILQLVAGLESESIDEQKSTAMEIRLLAKNKPENRLKIAKAGAIKPLVAIISSSDLKLQEIGVTALLNLSLCDENKEAIASSGAIKPLVWALKTGTPKARENAACALLRLSQVGENKLAIGRSGAIAPLVDLLENGGIRGKKDAATALYSLCSAKENKVRAVQAGVMKPLVELMADLGSSMVDKAAFVLKGLVSVPEARVELVKEAGIPVLVEIVEVGTHRQKETAVAVLLQVCEESAVFRDMVAREGAIPPVVALSQSAATSRSTKQKAETLVELLRQPRSGKPAARASEVSGLTNIEEVHAVHTVGCAGRKDRHSNNWTVKGDQDHPIPLSVHADSLTSILGMRKLKVHNLFGKVPKSLPSIFQANSFVELHLPRYNHRLLWAGKLALVNLRLINLKHSSKLISLPDLSMAQKIVHLNLRGCVKLIQVSYIRNLTKLEKLNLSNCENIKVLPSLIGLQNLKEFYLSGCSNLWNLPPSIVALNSLVVLDLKNCAQLCELPRITSGLRSLQKLNISGCTNILRSLDIKGSRESQISYGRFLNSTISGTYGYERASQFVEEATSPEQKKSTTKKAKKISAPEVVKVETTVERELTIKNFNWKEKMEKDERKRKSVELATATCKEVRVKRICNNSDDFVFSICQPSHETLEEAILDSGSKLIGDTEPAPPGRSPNLENTLTGLAIEDPTSGEGEDVGLGIQMEPEVISLCNSSDHPRKECSERVQLDVSKTAAPCGPHKFAEKSCDGGMESKTEVFSHQTIETEPLSSYEENDEIDWLKNEIQKLQEQLEASEKRRDGFRECYDSLESELWPLCAELEVDDVNLKEQKQKHEESELEASNAWEDLKNLVAQSIF